MVMSSWLASFKSLLNPEFSSRLKSCPLDPNIQQVDSSELNTPITKDEVKTALRQAPRNKALGIDNIDPSYLNHDSIIEFLLSLFNHCLLKGGCPAAWKKTLIYPIHKSGQLNIRDPLSYRGISLQSTVLKLYTHILNQRLSSWLEENNILSDLQNGFRPQRSCQDHMLSLYNIVLNRRLSGNDTFCCFVDFRKAFDSVSRGRLWDKLSQYGINGPFLSSIQSLYDDYQCCVEVNRYCTPWFEVNNGVKQGCLLSPSLFNLYINDLLEKLCRLGFGVQIGGDSGSVDRKVPALAYADDIVLIAPTPEVLQSMLTILDEWCLNNGIDVNISKTKIMHFRKKRRPCSSYDFICSNSKIEYCSEYKYLGLWINEHLDLDMMVGKVHLAARKTLGGLIAKCKDMGSFHYDTFSYLYDTLVAPVMDYSACIWGFKWHKCLEDIQNNAIRFYLWVGKNFPIASLVGDMGWIPAECRHIYNVIKWWIKINSHSNGRISKCILAWSMDLANKGLKNWCWEVNKLLVCLQLPSVFSNQEHYTANSYTLNRVKIALINMADCKWHNLLNKPPSNSETGGKLRHYRMFKIEPSPAGYVLAPLGSGQRWALASLRSGCLPLAVETGRHRIPKVPLEQRVCKICNNNSIEDEYHFIMECTPLKELRQQLFLSLSLHDITFMQLDNYFKFLYIIQAEQCTSVIAKYVYKMFKLRTSFLYHA